MRPKRGQEKEMTLSFIASSLALFLLAGLLYLGSGVGLGGYFAVRRAAGRPTRE